MHTPAGHLSHLRGAGEGLFLAGGCALLSWSLIGPTILASSASALEQAINLAYPMLDAMALAAVMFVALRRVDDPPAGLGLLGLGIVCVAISNSAFWYLSSVHGGVPGATPLDAGWVAGFLLIALAALPGRARERRDRFFAHRRAMLALPVLPTAIGILVVTVTWLKSGELRSDEALLGILSVVVTLSVGLLVIVFYESSALMSNLEGRVRERTAELRTTERYYRALVQRSSDIVMVVGPDLKIRYVSDSIRTIFGHSPQKLEGCGLQALGEGGRRRRGRSARLSSAHAHAGSARGVGVD